MYGICALQVLSNEAGVYSILELVGPSFEEKCTEVLRIEVDSSNCSHPFCSGMDIPARFH